MTEKHIHKWATPRSLEHVKKVFTEEGAGLTIHRVCEICAHAQRAVVWWNDLSKEEVQEMMKEDLQ